MSRTQQRMGDMGQLRASMEDEPTPASNTEKQKRQKTEKQKRVKTADAPKMKQMTVKFDAAMRRALLRESSRRKEAGAENWPIQAILREAVAAYLK